MGSRAAALSNQLRHAPLSPETYGGPAGHGRAARFEKHLQPRSAAGASGGWRMGRGKPVGLRRHAGPRAWPGHDGRHRRRGGGGHGHAFPDGVALHAARPPRHHGQPAHARTPHRHPGGCAAAARGPRCLCGARGLSAPAHRGRCLAGRDGGGGGFRQFAIHLGPAHGGAHAGGRVAAAADGQGGFAAVH